MENASDALIMAFAVLIFVLALSISISSFSLARQTTQSVIELTDREFDYTYVSIGDTTREVGTETIVPTLYRAYKENYIVRFFDRSGNKLNVYQKKVNRSFIKTNEINLENEAIANQEKATLFIDSLLNGKLDQYFNNSKNLQEGEFYSIIKGKKFKEELGIYYIEDLEDSSTGGMSSLSDLKESDINKTEKRVITYTEI